MKVDKAQILFVGEQNAVRSLMAERMLTAKTHGAALARSAGIAAEGPHPLSLFVLRELSIDAGDHKPSTLSDMPVFNFDLVVTFGPSGKERFVARVDTTKTNGTQPEDPAATIVGLLAPLHMHWEIPDPSEGGQSRGTITQFREARDRIATRIDSLMREGLLEALRERKVHAIGHVDRSALALIAMDAQARLFLFNAKAERLTGRSRSDVLGLNCRVVFPPHGICGTACLFSGKAGCPARDHEHVVGLNQSSGGSHPFRVHITRVQGVGIPHRVTVAVLHDTNGMPPTPAPAARAFHGIEGRSRPILEAIAVIRQVARSDYPVLITGESGTGKELAARAVHVESRRSGGPFVPINCGALPEHILESELFGHVKGAFTGAIRDKKGRFELADGGTLLLDEVGELSPTFQVKLLRVLQEKRFERVGDERVVQVDVRVISSTNRDLRTLVKEGSFREDLFYRLAVVPLTLPPLRDRIEDLPTLVNHVLGQIRKDGSPIRRVSPHAMGLLAAHSWPGNIRELMNALQYASIHCRGEEIEPAHLPFEISGIRPVIPLELPEYETLPSDETPAIDDQNPARGTTALTPERVAEAIRQAGGNKLKAAKLLGIGRATLYRFLDTHGAGS